MHGHHTKTRKSLADGVAVCTAGTCQDSKKLEIPFGVDLNADNRWIKLAGIMPWEKIEERYAQNFDKADGHEAKASRLAFGALFIQNRLSGAINR